MFDILLRCDSHGDERFAASHLCGALNEHKSMTLCEFSACHTNVLNEIKPAAQIEFRTFVVITDGWFAANRSDYVLTHLSITGCYHMALCSLLSPCDSRTGALTIAWHLVDRSHFATLVTAELGAHYSAGVISVVSQ